MWPKYYGLLATAILIAIAAIQAAPATKNATSADAAVNITINETIFKLPSNIDEDELLHETGLFLQSLMNLEEDPCEDFYEYACGNWKDSERVPTSGRKDSMLHIIQKEINELLVEFLKNDTKDGKSGEGKARTFYSSCLTNGEDLNLGFKTLLDNEKELCGKLKLTGKDDWIIINFMSPYNVYPLLPMTINYSTLSRRFEISLNLPGSNLENFQNSTKTEDLFKKLGLMEAEFKTMLEFERNLTSKVESRNKTEKLTLNEFLEQHQADPIDWKHIFTEAFGENMQGEWLVHNKIANFTNLEKFLRKSNTENLRNYVKWRTLVKFYNIWKSELPDDESREQICRQHTESYFTYALIPWFIEYLYDAERREDTLMVAESIHESFLNMTAKYTWLDEDTRSHVISKLQAMDIMVGYKDDMRHREMIDAIYSDLEISEDWFKNLLTLEANHARIRLHSVHKTVLPPMLSPYSVNAYYADYINSAFITMGISQMPLYHRGFPASLKYGGIGMLIGHEMAHSLDSNGYDMDYDGKYYEWGAASERHFLERIRCLENQYNKFIYRGVQTNGSLTMPDNIADNAGTRFAYYAYQQRHGRKEGLQKPLPGVNLTNNKLFFVKMAQTWCTGRDDSYKIRQIKSDVHAYYEFRVLGTLRNMPEFSETFSCKLGSQMNPLKKCVVW